MFLLPGSANDSFVFDIGVAHPLTVGNGLTGCNDRYVEIQFGTVADTKYFSCGYRKYVAGNLASRGDSPNLDQALADYAEALRLDPREGVTYASIGELHFDQGRYLEAAQQFTRGLGINPSMPRARMGRAAAYIKLGKQDQAIADLQIARQGNPDLSAGFGKIGDTIRPVADRLIGGQR